MPSQWQGIYPKLIESPLAEVRDLAVGLAVQFGDARAFATLETMVTDPNEVQAKRLGRSTPCSFSSKTIWCRCCKIY